VPPDGYTTARGTSVAAPFVSATLAWVWTRRPELDHTQLVELIRRTARDVAPPGRDEQTGFGVIDIAAALAAPAPIPDPLEPNDDVRWATTPAPASLAARIDAVEDAEDVYRVDLAAGGRGRQVAVTENRSAGPVTVFVHVRLRPGVARASYALWLRASSAAALP